jgi:hypothetical protein
VRAYRARVREGDSDIGPLRVTDPVKVRPAHN